MNLFDIVAPMTMAEAQTDYQKRRQRERDVDAGRPVKASPKNPQTDYAKKRAQDKRDMALGENAWHAGDNAWSSENHEMVENNESNPVTGAIVRRIMMQRTDLLKQYGPKLVGAAIDNVADYVGDVEEIGSSDVSGWVNQVERMLKENPPEAFDEGFQDFNKVEPYEVCLAGKPVKTFDYYEDARRFHDNWKKKLYAQGEQAKADRITLNPVMKEAVWFPTVNVPKFPKPEVDDTKWVVTYKIPATGETKIVAVAGDTEEHARKNLLARTPAAKIVSVKSKDMSEAIVASGPSKPLDDRAVRKLVWDTMKINADTGEQAIQRALSVLAKKPQSRMVQDLQDKFRGLADRLAQGVAEGQLDELSPETLKSYLKKSKNHSQKYDQLGNKADEKGDEELANKMWNKGDNRYAGAEQARVKLADLKDKKKGVAEVANPTQQAAIAIAKKKEQGVTEDWIDDDAAEPLARYFADLYYGDFSATYKVKLTSHIYQAIQNGELSIEQLKADIDMLEKEKGIKEMDKSQPGAAGWNIDDYPLGAKGTTAKPTTVKNVVKTAAKDLDAAFNSPEQLKKDADYRAYRKGVKQSRKEQPKPIKEFAPTPVPGDNDDLSTEAQKDGFRIGASSVDGMPLEQAFGYTQWDEKYKLAFSSGWVKGRQFKIKHAKNDGVDLVLQKNGSLVRAQGVKENQTKFVRTHKPNCGWNFGHDCDCGGTLTHAKNCGHRFGHDCDCGLDKAKQPVKESYWTKLQNERNTKLNSLVNELKESVKK